LLLCSAAVPAASAGDDSSPGPKTMGMTKPLCFIVRASVPDCGGPIAPLLI
jgi:hypothetical protein